MENEQYILTRIFAKNEFFTFMPTLYYFIIIYLVIRKTEYNISTLHEIGDTARLPIVSKYCFKLYFKTSLFIHFIVTIKLPI